MNCLLDNIYSSAFPIRLYTILEHEDPSIIGWASSGVAFRVKDVDRFRDETLPRYFRHQKITSFQRQLNLYGFIRVLKGYHLQLQLRRPHLITMPDGSNWPSMMMAQG